MKNLTWQNPEQLFVAQELINKVKSKCCGIKVTKEDVKIAKNYLTEKELQRLNLLVSHFLNFAEFQALEERPMRMTDWIAALDNQIIALQRKLLEGKGSVSHQEAIEKAEQKFNIYRQKRNGHNLKAISIKW